MMIDVKIGVSHIYHNLNFSALSFDIFSVFFGRNSTAENCSMFLTEF